MYVTVDSCLPVRHLFKTDMTVDISVTCLVRQPMVYMIKVRKNTWHVFHQSRHLECWLFLKLPHLQMKHICCWITYWTFILSFSLGSFLTLNGEYFCSCRWYTWAVYWSSEVVWVWWISSWSKLLIFGRLCRQRQAVPGNNLSIVSIQDQISRKFLFAARKPWVCKYQQNIWFLWWM